MIKIWRIILGLVLIHHQCLHGQPPMDPSESKVLGSVFPLPQQEKCTDLTALKSWEPNPAYQVRLNFSL